MVNRQCINIQETYNKEPTTKPGTRCDGVSCVFLIYISWIRQAWVPSEVLVVWSWHMMSLHIMFHHWPDECPPAGPAPWPGRWRCRRVWSPARSSVASAACRTCQSGMESNEDFMKTSLDFLLWSPCPCWLRLWEGWIWALRCWEPEKRKLE